MDQHTRPGRRPGAIERILRQLGLLPPEPKLVIARVPRRPAPWPRPR